MDKSENGGPPDTVFGTKYVYCAQHCAVHATGWCTVSITDKVALIAETVDEARTEWAQKKAALGIK